MNNPVLHAHQLSKRFAQADGSSLEIFSGINLSISQGESISIVGSSGSGKTSLLQILAGLDQPSSGQIIVCNQDLATLASPAMCHLRNQKLGFIYQFHHLLPEFTAWENTIMPLIIGNALTAATQDYAHYILDKLGLSHRLTHYPSQLSGGERQRVAIARAVINNPAIIFADEPTGNLDNTTAHQVLEIFLKLQQELATSVIVVTHDPAIAKQTNRQYSLHEGQLQLQSV
jgi:lipoprotein-releasing system ATP-binding protein